MNGNNGRPLTKRQTVQLLVILTILAWATQTLIKQWGFGQELPVTDGNTPAELPQPVASQKFVPSNASAGPIAIVGTLELRSEAAVGEKDVKLRQVCRWSETDAAAFRPIADLVLFRLTETTPYKSVTVVDLRQTLRDAGVNVAMINFAGATSCVVSRADVHVDERVALQEWIDARQGKQTLTPPAATEPIAAAPATRPVADKSGQSLREILIADACIRLNIDPNVIQITFNPADEKVLNLIEPYFRFNVSANRVRDLGDVSWDVLIVTDTGSQKVSIAATARAWQNEVVLVKPVSYRQVIADSDVTERRTLLDHLGSETFLTRTQAVGQQASRELKPGTVITARLVDPVPLCKSGDLVTLVVTRGAVQLRTVVRAIEGGTFGQTIRARNEATNEILEITLTGPDEARLGPADPTASANP